MIDFKKLAKRVLRGSATNDGSMLWTDGQMAHKFLTVTTLLKGTDNFPAISDENCELVKRPQIGWSAACGMLQVGMEAATCARAGADPEVFKKTGLPPAFDPKESIAKDIKYANLAHDPEEGRDKGKMRESITML